MLMINAGLTDSRTPGTDATEVLLARRSHGSLDAITDSERRGLRPIGATAREVADRTSELLAGLLALPSVRIFQGVRQATADVPLIEQAVSAGNGLVLVESVAWPPGRYAMTAGGKIHCDGVYTGQSANPLIAAARHWQAVLPPGHRVNAIVIVYPAAPGRMSLPAHSARGPVWARAGYALSLIRTHLPSGQPAISIRAVLALAAATMTERDTHNPA